MGRGVKGKLFHCLGTQHPPPHTTNLLLGSRYHLGRPAPSRSGSQGSSKQRRCRGGGEAIAGPRRLPSEPVAGCGCGAAAGEQEARGAHRVTAAAARIDARGSPEARTAPPAPGRAAAQPTEGTACRPGRPLATLPKKGNDKTESQPAITVPRGGRRQKHNK